MHTHVWHISKYTNTVTYTRVYSDKASKIHTLGGDKLKKYINVILQVLFICVGIFISLNAVFATMVCNMNAGIIANYLLAFMVLGYGIFYKKLSQKLPKWFIGLFYTGLVAIAIIIPVMFISGRTDNVSYKEDAIIVLGAAVRGEEVSGALARRLDAAIKYYHQNPEVVIVVTGGQGPQEDITEALAMERYLMEHGIPQSSIIKEEKATSTSENFKYSKELLDEYFGYEYTVAYITDDYHIFRAGQLGKLAGLPPMTHCHSNTAKSIMLPSGLRECMAIVQLWIFKR